MNPPKFSRTHLVLSYSSAVPYSRVQGATAEKEALFTTTLLTKKKIAIQNALLQVLIGCCKKLRTDNSKAPHIPFTFHKNKGNTCPKL